MATATHDISTLLAARNQSVAAFGLNNIVPILERELEAHNRLVEGVVGELADFTTDRQRKYGVSVAGEMEKVDEYGRSRTQAGKPGDTVGFPLDLYQFAIGWTRKWFENKTPADMAIALQAAERAHLRALLREIKRAFMLSANYTFTDHLVDNVDLFVKRMVNADGATIPEGPNNETFDGATHTHYLARAGGSLAASDVTGAINTLVEHDHGKMVKIAINKTDETAFRALTGFIGYPDPRVVYRNTDTPGTTLDITRLDNRAIGIFGGAEVWVKPWMPASYHFIWDAGSDKPVVIRQRENGTMPGLRIAGENDAFPLHAQYMEAEFGPAVWNRTNGVMLYTGGTSYADPVIN